MPLLEEIGDSVLVVGDEATLKVHVHTDDPDSAKALFARARVDRARGHRRHERADRRARGTVCGDARTGVVAVASGEGMKRMFRELGALVVDGGKTMNPSTEDILEGIQRSPAVEVIVLPNSRNVVMAAEEAARLSDKDAIVVPTHSQQAALAVLVELDPARRGRRERRAAGRLRSTTSASAASLPRPRTIRQGRFVRGDAVGFAGGEVIAWGGAGSTLRRGGRSSPRTPRSSP